MSLNFSAGLFILIYAFGMPTYFLAFHQGELSPAITVMLIFLNLAAFGLFFKCYNRENPQERNK